MTLSPTPYWYDAFDMRTSIFIYLMALYICTYVMAVTWLQARRHFRGIGYFLLDFALNAAGVSLALFRGTLPDWTSVLMANTLMFAGNLSLLWGMACFMDLKIRLEPYAAAVSGFILAYAWYTFATPDIRMRIILFSGLSLPVFLHTIHLIFVRADADHRRYALNTGITMLLFTLVYLLRVYFAFSGPVPDSYFNTPMPDTVLHITGLGLLILLTHSLHLMINGKLLHQTRRHARTLEELATRDSLTGLYNRRKMEALLKRESARFNRHGCPFSIILCDIDHFKSVNDTLGHDAGDLALTAVSEIMAQNIRAEDRAGRWGGEEFLILLPETPEDTGRKVAEKLRALIWDRAAKAAGTRSRMTLSFGVAQACGDLNRTLKRADQALYRAKAGGRNRVETHTDTVQGERKCRLTPL